MTELDQAPAAVETTSPEQAGERRPGSHDSQTRYPTAVTTADTDPGYYDGDTQAALAADTTPTRQQAARDASGPGHQAADGNQASADTAPPSRDVPASGPDGDIEAILHENDHLSEPRTRQQAARDTAVGSHTPESADAAGSRDTPASGRDPDIEAILHENDHHSEARTRQQAAREDNASSHATTGKDGAGVTDQQPRPGPDPLTHDALPEHQAENTAENPAPKPDAREQHGQDQGDRPYTLTVLHADAADRTLGDTTPTGIGLKPTGEQIMKMENEDASKPEKLRRKFLEGIDDINDAARDNASLGHDLLTRHHPPAGHAMTEVPHPLPEAPHEGGPAPDITSAGLVAGVLLIEATRRSREPVHRIAEAAKGYWPWR
jgi:hypothetical protein